MRKKKMPFGDLELTIAELNTAQVEELFTTVPDIQETKLWVDRKWRVIAWALNNAVKPPTKEEPLGSDSEPFSMADMKVILGFASSAELYNEILAFSGLRTEPVKGESRTAPVEISASSTSAAA